MRLAILYPGHDFVRTGFHLEPVSCHMSGTLSHDRPGICTMLCLPSGLVLLHLAQTNVHPPGGPRL